MNSKFEIVTNELYKFIKYTLYLLKTNSPRHGVATSGSEQKLFQRRQQCLPTCKQISK